MVRIRKPLKRWIMSLISNWLRLLKKKATTEGEETNIAEDDLDLLDPFPEPISIEIKDVIDLHTFSPKDVKRVTEEYLLEAYRIGFRVVRIIHGKGIGVQRKTVHSVLARTSFVEEWMDAPSEAGGLGATIVKFIPNSETINT
jgi:dsDNA-specific endonuclease/ATPase MutS2